MDIAKQIIDQRVYKILADNPDLFSADDAEHKRSKAFLLLGVASYLDIDIAEAIRHCRSYQTLKEHPNIDFSQVYILVRLYEVNDDENIVKDITYATNSQNPIDFRDLKSNDSIQILLETSAADLVNIFLHI